VFRNTTPNLQDQDRDHSVQDQDRFFWSQTGLVLRPMVSQTTSLFQNCILRESISLWPDHSNFRSTVLRELNERRQYFVASLYVSFFCKLLAINDFELLTSCDLQILGQVNQSLIMWSLGYVKLLMSFTFVQSKIHTLAYFGTVAEPMTRFFRNGRIPRARF